MRKKENKQYFLTLALTLTALVFMVSYNFTTFYSNAISNMNEVGESSLAKETEYLKGYLTKGMDVLQVTAITTEYMMQNGASADEIESFLLEESERYMVDIDANFTGIYGLFQGEYIDGIGWVPPEDYVPKEREWYIAAKEAGGAPTIVSPYLDAQTNTIMISVSKMLYDMDSVISLDIVLDQIQIITEDINMDGMGYGFVIDKEGLVVAHSDEVEKGKNYGQDAEMKRLLARVYETGQGTFTANIGGEECTVFTNMVMDDWYVVMIVSHTKLYQDIRGILIQNVLVCVGVFLFIAYFCTVAFRKIGLHMKNAEESRERLEIMNGTIMRTLARTIDAKDRYTNGHSQRVAKYALALAERMGKTEEEQKNIYYAALLHDVGKIRIPDTIINKPAKLTDEEFEYIKLHPVAGYYILRDIHENALIAQGAKWHHERYDGKGYPNGLAGEDIPEVARIIGVADTYDAMTSNRSYREQMSQEKVRSEIERGRGTQFDPKIADIMLQMIDEDREYQLRQKDEFTRKILVIDKEADSFDAIENLLREDSRYTVSREVSGEAALEALHKDAATADLVIFDVRKPDREVFHICTQMREQFGVPVVFLTEDRSALSMETAGEIGVEGYLLKPFMPKELLETLRSILQEKVDI